MLDSTHMILIGSMGGFHPVVQSTIRIDRIHSSRTHRKIDSAKGLTDQTVAMVHAADSTTALGLYRGSRSGGLKSLRPLNPKRLHVVTQRVIVLLHGRWFGGA